MGLNYDELKICKITHLYAIWIVSYLAKKQNISSAQLGKKLIEFYTAYNRDSKEAKEGTPLFNYRHSLSYNTRSISSRKERKNALIDYLKSDGLELKDSTK